MFFPATRRGRSQDEPEKPFWITFADMMTALMVLFLLVMSVALLAITKTVNQIDRDRSVRDAAIKTLLDEVELTTKKYGVIVNRERQVVDFGEQAHFPLGSFSLTQRQAVTIREVSRKIIGIANEPLGRRWLKEILVEGFTDRSGPYLYNLHLSLERSETVVCVLLAKKPFGSGGLGFRHDWVTKQRLRPNGVAFDEKSIAGKSAINDFTADEQSMVRKLFVVGGYSANSAKQTASESRRIELQLQFLLPDEHRGASPYTATSDVGVCQL